MNGIFNFTRRMAEFTLKSGFQSKQVKQSYVPAQRRQPQRMPVIPLRNGRSLKTKFTLKDRLQQQIEDVKSIELNMTAVINITLAIITLAIGIGVAHYSYTNRQQVIELSKLRSERDDLQQTWTYLTKDQNQLSAFSRIEATAMGSLNMHRPEKDDIYIMRKSES